MDTKRRAIGVTIGGLVALVAALSAHAVMLEYFHVPHPELPHLWWTRLPDHIMQTAAMIWLLALLPPETRASPFRAALVLLLVFLTVTETLFRDPFMEVVNLSNLTLYPFVDVLPSYLTTAVLVVGVVATYRLCRKRIGAFLTSVGLTCLTYLLFRPWLDVVFTPVHAWTAAREGHGVYDPPYDWHILVPAYATFAEPVIGAFLLCAAASRRLLAEPLHAWGVLALVIFAMRGVLFSCLTYIPVAPYGAGTAILSEGQFVIENAVLAIGVAATWILVVRRHATQVDVAAI